MTTAAAAAFAIAALASCGSSNSAPTSGASIERKWEIVDASGNSTKGSLDEAYITFDGKGGVSGCTGANTFNGSYTLTPDGSLQFNDMISTRMAAGPYRETEAAVFRALDEAKGYKVDGDEAQILDASGREVMRLRQ